MCKMYGIIEELCTQKGIKPGKLCADLGISRGIMGDLKTGRTKKLSSENVSKVAAYFGVSTDYILGIEQPEKAPTTNGERSISDDELKFALWGNSSEIDDDDLEDVRQYAAFIKERKKGKK